MDPVRRRYPALPRRRVRADGDAGGIADDSPRPAAGPGGAASGADGAPQRHADAGERRAGSGRGAPMISAGKGTVRGKGAQVGRLIGIAAVLGALVAPASAGAITNGSPDGEGHPNVGGLVAEEARGARGVGRGLAAA